MREYIQSGIVEAYVLELATPEDMTRFKELLPLYPELQLALHEYEVALEKQLLHPNNLVPPPPGTWKKIEENINKLPATDAGN